MGAMTHNTFLVSSLFENIAQPDIHSAVLKNAEGVIGLEIYGSGSQLSAIPIGNATATTVYYPHLASDAFWWTGILAYNPSADPCDLIVSPFDKDGFPLPQISSSVPANGQYIGVTTTLKVPPAAVWLQIEATKPVLGFEMFGNPQGSALAGFSGTQLSGRQGVFARIEKDGWTGIAMVNLEYDPAIVIMTAYDDGGNIIASQDHSLGAHTRTAKYAQEFFLQDISRATYITYASNRNLAGFLLNGSAEGKMLNALPAR